MTKEGLVAIENADGTMVYVREIEFDVAVTVADTQAANAGLGIEVFGAKIGGGGDVKYENSAISRVKFVVPISFPSSESGPEKKKREEDKVTRSGGKW